MSCSPVPATMSDPCGLTESDVRLGGPTVKVAEPEIPPAFAVMVTVLDEKLVGVGSAATPVATPTEETVAT